MKKLLLIFISIFILSCQETTWEATKVPPTEAKSKTTLGMLEGDTVVIYEEEGTVYVIQDSVCTRTLSYYNNDEFILTEGDLAGFVVIAFIVGIMSGLSMLILEE